MPDQREAFPDPEEATRSSWAGIRAHMWTSLPTVVSKDTSDGHTVQLQSTIKRTVQDATYGETTYESFPPFVDVPIKFASGGGVTHTHPVKEGDEGFGVVASRSIDAWHQNGGEQPQIYNRLNSLADLFYVPGIRSDPRKLPQVEKDSMQLRSDDKKHVIDHHPDSGTHIKSVDPSTPPASDSFDPFKSAKKFYDHIVQGAKGVLHSAVDSGTKHLYSLTHDAGHLLDVVNGLHSVKAHPDDGASLNAKDMLHRVLAHPDLGSMLSASGGAHVVQADPNAGVKISSSQQVAISAPPGGLSLPSGGVSSDALASGAASDNVGTLGGDLAGTLPNPRIVAAATLLNFANDSAAATGGVPVHGLYRNGSIVMVRVA